MRLSSRKAILFACAAFSTLAASPMVSSAQPAPAAAGENQVVRYEPDFFKPFQVTTALDMVFYVPGFSFSSGQDVRGFAGAAGNVLVDGQRPVSKNGLDMTLNNISASQVEYIELISGGAPGIDMQGYGKVINIVRKKDGKATINFGGNIKFYPHDDLPAGFFSYSRNRDGKTTDIYIEAFRFNDNGVFNGHRYTYTPDMSDTSPDYMYIDQVGGGWGNLVKVEHSRPFAGGKLAFNGSYNPIYYDMDAMYDSADDGLEHLDYKEIDSEIGLQWERKLTKSLTLELNALRTHERESQTDLYTEPGFEATYTALGLTDERIFSAKLSWQLNEKLSFKFGAETVYNSLDNTSLYVEDGSAQNVPSDEVLVEEDRNEYFVVSNWQAMPKLNIEAALKVETSTISVRQDNRSESFVYPKPKIQAVWSPNDAWKVTWRSERILGQLDFGDFASSVSLQDQVIKAGNTGIVPQKQWQHAMTFDYKFWDKGAVSVTFERNDLEDTLDHLAIVTDEGVYDARGNVGDGRIDAVSMTMNLPLDKLKIKGGLLKFDYTRRWTQVTDPITGASRSISDINPDNYTINFSQNLTKYRTSWGVEIISMNNASRYNARELYRYRSTPWYAWWAEYKTKNGLTYGIVLQNPQRRQNEQYRTTWADLREKSVVEQQQYTHYQQKPWVIVRVRKDL